MSDYVDPHYEADAYMRMLVDLMPHVTPMKRLEIIEAITAGHCRGHAYPVLTQRESQRPPLPGATCRALAPCARQPLPIARESLRSP